VDEGHNIRLIIGEPRTPDALTSDSLLDFDRTLPHVSGVALFVRPAYCIACTVYSICNAQKWMQTSHLSPARLKRDILLSHHTVPSPHPQYRCQIHPSRRLYPKKCIYTGWSSLSRLSSGSVSCPRVLWPTVTVSNRTSKKGPRVECTQAVYICHCAP
jgi:hypothetical protein